MANESWVEWLGGDCPVSDDTPVGLRYRDHFGETCSTFSEVPQALSWQHRPRPFGGDIVAYRVLSGDEASALRRRGKMHNDKLTALRGSRLAIRVNSDGSAYDQEKSA